MSLSYPVATVVLSGFGYIVAQIAGPLENQAFDHAKEYTLSGILIVGIIFLYRELKRTRDEAEKKDQVYQANLERLTSASVESLKENTTATKELTAAIDKQNNFYDTLVKDVVREKITGK